MRIVLHHHNLHMREGGREGGREEGGREGGRKGGRQRGRERRYEERGIKHRDMDHLEGAPTAKDLYYSRSL
jgi:hypothetical protein